MGNKRQNNKWDNEIRKLCKDNGITKIKSMSMSYFKSLIKMSMYIGYNKAMEEKELEEK